MLDIILAILLIAHEKYGFLAEYAPVVTLIQATTKWLAGKLCLLLE